MSRPSKLKFNWTRISSDVNGNPRHVLHFLDLVRDIGGKGVDLHEQYRIAVKRANKMGGRKFHNKQYGGGIAFQSYNLEDTERFIRKTLKTITNNK